MNEKWITDRFGIEDDIFETTLKDETAPQASSMGSAAMQKTVESISYAGTNERTVIDVHIPSTERYELPA